MYFSKQTIELAIDSIANVGHSFSRTTGNADLLSYYLILKKLNVSHTEWQAKSTIFSDSESILKSLWQLGGLFEHNENPGKKCCLLFSSFSKRSELVDSYFYNKGTEFYKLASRVKDTIDNTAADYLLDKGQGDTYRFKSNVVSILKNNYSKKFNVESIAIWVFRYHDFFSEISINEIVALFLSEFNIDNDEARELFYLPKSITVKYESFYIDPMYIRHYLNAEIICEILPSKLQTNYDFYSKTKDILSYDNYRGAMKTDKILSLLDKNLQLIITGVPGTGKSHTINELKNHYDEVSIIQFHQSYSYQEFILGKTILNGNVKIEKGTLLKFLDSMLPDKKYLLVLDEINRGNISSVFGEALYALDRGNKIKLTNDVELVLPSNLHILGTMNTADRSIAIIDFAIRRRFIFVELLPDYNLIDQNIKIEGVEILGDLLKLINEKIIQQFENEDYILGHSYFLGTNVDSIEDVYDILHYKIFPMIIEYSHGDKSVLFNIFSETFIKSPPEKLIVEIKKFINKD
ncbi:McrB family protein [Shewanella sp. HL-SH8]|uniref:McrB family protein n=1 Tax=Shewanella sp. HL-SH8 TaxID=3436242 RepID=UPI003EB7C57A